MKRGLFNISQRDKSLASRCMASRVFYILLQPLLLVYVNVLLVVLYTANCFELALVMFPKFKLFQGLPEHTLSWNFQSLTGVGCEPPCFAHVDDLDFWFYAPTITFSLWRDVVAGSHHTAVRCNFPIWSIRKPWIKTDTRTSGLSPQRQFATVSVVDAISLTLLVNFACTAVVNTARSSQMQFTRMRLDESLSVYFASLGRCKRK